MYYQEIGGRMKVVAYIPIKLNNERCPGKNIKKFDDGTPLCSFLFNTISQVNNIDEIYCYCSDESIENYLQGRVRFLKRDPKLDLDSAKFQDICDSFIEQVDADIIVLSHVTSPFIKAESIEECVERVKSGEYDSAFAAGRVQEFLWQESRPLNFDPSSVVRSQDLPLIYKESIGCFVFTRKEYMQNKRRIGLHPYIKEISKIEEVDIDYPEDFEIANAIYMNILKVKK